MMKQVWTFSSKIEDRLKEELQEITERQPQGRGGGRSLMFDKSIDS